MLNDALFARWTPRLLGLLRIVAGYLFITHGTAKILGIPYVRMFEEVPLLSLLGAAGLIELAGGALVILGLCTRPVAFILSGQMAFAYFLGHAPQGNVLVPMLNQGELAVLYCFLFLFFAAAGGGAWGIDAIRNQRRLK
jgi:putative oxidoreductase